MEESNSTSGFVPEPLQETVSNTDPFAGAANTFGTLAIRLDGKLNTLGAKAVRRVFKALVEVPLNEKPIVLMDNEEKELFLIGQRMLEAKMVMIMATVQANQQKAEKEVKEYVGKQET